MGKPIPDVLNIDIPEVLQTHPLLRRVHRQDGGRGDAHRPFSYAHDPARATGRGGCDHAMELPDADGHLEDRAHSGGRQLRGAQARRAGAAVLHRAWRSCLSRRGARRACSTWSTASGQRRARRWPCTRMWHKITFTGSTAVGKLLMGYAGPVQHETRGAGDAVARVRRYSWPTCYDLDAAVDRARRRHLRQRGTGVQCRLAPAGAARHS